MHYWQYTLHNNPELNDILVALLGDAPFDTFEEHETGIHAYLPATDDNVAEADQLLAELATQFEFSHEKTFIEGQNWNEIWESNFHPVVVRDLCTVRADFHAPNPEVRFDLVINPKMAFGTGHHETTWMCLSHLESLPVAGTRLLDYGCGTGVLAILASKLGAAHIEAVDIESESYLNTQANAEVNGVHNITPRLGTLEAVEGRDFDGILANINRHIILNSLDRLAAMSRPGAWLLVSGILLQDETIVVDAAQSAGFLQKNTEKRGNWLCIHFAKEG
jgi:ribosomal protein L11 methyltransferase